MGTREKKVINTPSYTRTDAEEFFARYCQSAANIVKLTADMDIKMTAIREQYQDKLTILEKEKEEALDKLHFFAETNQELFVDKKSLELTHGIIGFRKGQPKLKNLPKFTWKKVLEKVSAHLPEFIRKKEELDKEGLVANREVKDVKDKFKLCGIEVVQDETFYVEPKTEEVAV